jgi:hypothetical protein
MSTKRLINKRSLCLALVVVAALSTLAAAGTAARPSRATVETPTGYMAPSTIATQLAEARAATAKYVNDLARAKADGYQIITRMIPNMGYHFMNPKVKGFNLRKPPILVYQHRGSSWQLGALEWVFTSKPAKPPIPGAQYGSFGAGCHYVDGTFVPEDSEVKCPTISPETGASFNFWHPLLITLHVWLWYPNPTGLFASMNPLAAAYNKG